MKFLAAALLSSFCLFSSYAQDTMSMVTGTIGAVQLLATVKIMSECQTGGDRDKCLGGQQYISYGVLTSSMAGLSFLGDTGAEKIEFSLDDAHAFLGGEEMSSAFADSLWMLRQQHSELETYSDQELALAMVRVSSAPAAAE